MKILQLCSKPPFPNKDGYAIAVNHISNALIQSSKNNLKVIAISTPKHAAKDIPSKYLNDTDFEHIFINTNIKIVPAFKNLFSKSSYNINRFYSNTFATRLKEILQKYNFDIVLLEGLFVCPYLEIISNYSNAKIILRAHNIESNIWKGLTEQTTNLIRKWYLNLLQKKLYNYEKNILSKMDGVICISTKDASWMKKQTTKSISTIPFAIDTENDTDYNFKENTLFHIGSMDWISNVNGVKWFLHKVFPLIIQKKKEVVLHLAGRNMPTNFNKFSNKNIVIDGEVDNTKTFMRKYNIMIVPIWSGSGMRIKILEGMAMGKTIISTTIGASGIHYENKKNILIADTVNQFVNEIIWCFDNIKESAKIGENAKLNIQKNYKLEKISEKLDSFLNKILNS